MREHHPDATLDEAVAVCNGVIWLANNIHNYGSDAWREYFMACVRDAKRVTGYERDDVNREEKLAEWVDDGRHDRPAEGDPQP